MQNPIDPARLLGRHSTVTTHTGTFEGTILAAGASGVSLSSSDRVRRFTPGELVSITC